MLFTREPRAAGPVLTEEHLKDIVNAVTKDCKKSLRAIDKLAAATASEEKALYPHLKTIMDKVEEKLADLLPGRAYFRQVVSTDKRLVVLDDPVFPEGDDNKPDFVIADVDDPRLVKTARAATVPSTSVSLRTPPYLGKKVYWRNCFSFIEVKAKAKLSPAQADKLSPAHADKLSPAHADKLSPAHADKLSPAHADKLSPAHTDESQSEAGDANKLSPAHADESQTEAGNANKTLVQGIDYSRYVFRSHPFNLFVYGVFVSGNNFCVGRFDRLGTLLSPDHRLTEGEGLSLFLKVVARLLWEMSRKDLGEDPTVSRISGRTDGKEYPQYKVTMGGKEDTRAWITVGPPIWVSSSLLGRGTVVWRVLSEGTRLPSILKIAWRSSNRKPELQIYDEIERILKEKNVAYPHNMARALTGGDVRLNKQTLMSVRALRGNDALTPPEIRGISDRVLHRVSLQKVGKPLWEYTSLEQFLRAIIGAVEAHKTLADNGIIHRDISAGNILIEVFPDFENGTMLELDIDETCGFLTDFEFASVPLPETRKTYVAVEAESSVGGIGTLGANQGKRMKFKVVNEAMPQKTQPGDGMTGTAIFMAQSVLEAVLDKKPIVRTAVHDVESFCWVILYAIYKHAIDDTNVVKNIPNVKNILTEDNSTFLTKLKQEFRGLFAAYSIQNLLNRRATALGLHHLQIYTAHIEHGEALKGLLLIVWGWINAFKPRQELPGKRAGNLENLDWAVDIVLQYNPQLDPERDDGRKVPDHNGILSVLRLCLGQIKAGKAV
ncbi:hypothetical protein L226DRAFT_567713 [Lentinus tigrinus ALCF2SS1-7]|uniref:uncharacterized protein n=1 Tax=Lentinus tigrinus ALCF2SS1-7 TaxID=1328758 RepID=UPI0011662DD8|nr:hypothetical protein L226DRAFT_567713 [Lentinus tigrinus ALCF2SS1-7]